MRALFEISGGAWSFGVMWRPEWAFRSIAYAACVPIDLFSTEYWEKLCLPQFYRKKHFQSSSDTLVDRIGILRYAYVGTHFNNTRPSIVPGRLGMHPSRAMKCAAVSRRETGAREREMLPRLLFPLFLTSLVKEDIKGSFRVCTTRAIYVDLCLEGAWRDILPQEYNGDAA